MCTILMLTFDLYTLHSAIINLSFYNRYVIINVTIKQLQQPEEYSTHCLLTSSVYQISTFHLSDTFTQTLSTIVILH